MAAAPVAADDEYFTQQAAKINGAGGNPAVAPGSDDDYFTQQAAKINGSAAPSPNGSGLGPEQAAAIDAAVQARPAQRTGAPAPFLPPVAPGRRGRQPAGDFAQHLGALPQAPPTPRLNYRQYHAGIIATEGSLKAAAAALTSGEADLKRRVQALTQEQAEILKGDQLRNEHPEEFDQDRVARFQTKVDAHDAALAALKAEEAALAARRQTYQEAFQGYQGDRAAYEGSQATRPVPKIAAFSYAPSPPELRFNNAAARYQALLKGDPSQRARADQERALAATALVPTLAPRAQALRQSGQALAAQAAALNALVAEQQAGTLSPGDERRLIQAGQAFKRAAAAHDAAVQALDQQRKNVAGLVRARLTSNRPLHTGTEYPEEAAARLGKPEGWVEKRFDQLLGYLAPSGTAAQRQQAAIVRDLQLTGAYPPLPPNPGHNPAERRRYTDLKNEALFFARDEYLSAHPQGGPTMLGIAGPPPEELAARLAVLKQNPFQANLIPLLRRQVAAEQQALQSARPGVAYANDLSRALLASLGGEVAAGAGAALLSKVPLVGALLRQPIFGAGAGKALGRIGARLAAYGTTGGLGGGTASSLYTALQLGEQGRGLKEAIHGGLKQFGPGFAFGGAVGAGLGLTGSLLGEGAAALRRELTVRLPQDPAEAALNQQIAERAMGEQGLTRDLNDYLDPQSPMTAASFGQRLIQRFGLTPAEGGSLLQSLQQIDGLAAEPLPGDPIGMSPRRAALFALLRDLEAGGGAAAGATGGSGPVPPSAPGRGGRALVPSEPSPAGPAPAAPSESGGGVATLTEATPGGFVQGPTGPLAGAHGPVVTSPTGVEVPLRFQTVGTLTGLFQSLQASGHPDAARVGAFLTRAQQVHDQQTPPPELLPEIERQYKGSPAQALVQALQGFANEQGGDYPQLADTLHRAATELRRSFGEAVAIAAPNAQDYDLGYPLAPVFASPYRSLTGAERALLTPEARRALLIQDLINSTQVLHPGTPPFFQVPNSGNVSQLARTADNLFQQAQVRTELEEVSHAPAAPNSPQAGRIVSGLLAGRVPLTPEPALPPDVTALGAPLPLSAGAASVPVTRPQAASLSPRLKRVLKAVVTAGRADVNSLRQLGLAPAAARQVLQELTDHGWLTPDGRVTLTPAEADRQLQAPEGQILPYVAAPLTKPAPVPKPAPKVAPKAAPLAPAEAAPEPAAAPAAATPAKAAAPKAKARPYDGRAIQSRSGTVLRLTQHANGTVDGEVTVEGPGSLMKGHVQKNLNIEKYLAGPWSLVEEAAPVAKSTEKAAAGAPAAPKATQPVETEAARAPVEKAPRKERERAAATPRAAAPETEAAAPDTDIQRTAAARKAIEALPSSASIGDILAAIPEEATEPKAAAPAPTAVPSEPEPDVPSAPLPAGYEPAGATAAEQEAVERAAQRGVSLPTRKAETKEGGVLPAPATGKRVTAARQKADEAKQRVAAAAKGFDTVAPGTRVKYLPTQMIVKLTEAQPEQGPYAWTATVIQRGLGNGPGADTTLAVNFSTAPGDWQLNPPEAEPKAPKPKAAPRPGVPDWAQPGVIFDGEPLGNRWRLEERDAAAGNWTVTHVRVAPESARMGFKPGRVMTMPDAALWKRQPVSDWVRPPGEKARLKAIAADQAELERLLAEKLIPQDAYETRRRALAAEQAEKAAAPAVLAPAEPTPEETEQIAAAPVKAKPAPKPKAKPAPAPAVGGAPEPSPLDLTGRLGRETTVKAGDAIVTVQYALVSVDELLTSNTDTLGKDPGYPAQFQPRDRTDLASQVQVSAIERKLDPRQLGENYVAQHGAPIIAPSGVVEGGNGRTIALRRLYRAKDAVRRKNRAAYEAWLKENLAGFGLDPALLATVKEPVLVRVRTAAMSEAARIQFVNAINARETLAMGAVMNAKQLAAQFTPELMRAFNPGADGSLNVQKNEDWVRAVLSFVPPNEQGELYTERHTAGHGYGRVQLSRNGLLLLADAVFYYAYGDDGLLQLMATAPADSPAKNISNALARAAGHWAGMRAGIAAGTIYPLDITGPLMTAVSQYMALQEREETVADYLAENQTSAEEEKLTPFDKEILVELDRRRKSPVALRSLLADYVDLARAAGNPVVDRAPALLEGYEKPEPTIRQVWDAAKLRSGPDPGASPAVLFAERGGAAGAPGGPGARRGAGAVAPEPGHAGGDRTQRRINQRLLERYAGPAERRFVLRLKGTETLSVPLKGSKGFLLVDPEAPFPVAAAQFLARTETTFRRALGQLARGLEPAEAAHVRFFGLLLLPAHYGISGFNMPVPPSAAGPGFNLIYLNPFVGSELTFSPAYRRELTHGADARMAARQIALTMLHELAHLRVQNNEGEAIWAEMDRLRAAMGDQNWNAAVAAITNALTGGRGADAGFSEAYRAGRAEYFAAARPYGGGYLHRERALPPGAGPAGGYAVEGGVREREGGTGRNPGPPGWTGVEGGVNYAQTGYRTAAKQQVLIEMDLHAGAPQLPTETRNEAALQAWHDAGGRAPLQVVGFRTESPAGRIPATGTFYALAVDRVAAYSRERGTAAARPRADQRAGVVQQLVVERLSFARPLMILGGHDYLARGIAESDYLQLPPAGRRAVTSAWAQVKTRGEPGYALLDKILARLVREQGYDGIVYHAATPRKAEVVDLREPAAMPRLSLPASAGVQFAESDPKALQEAQFEQAYHPETALAAEKHLLPDARAAMGALHREYAALPHGGEYAQARQLLTYLTRAQGVARRQAEIHLAQTLGSLTKAERRSFNWALYVRDLAEDFQILKEIIAEERRPAPLSEEALQAEAARRWTPPELVGEDGEGIAVWTPESVAARVAELDALPPKIHAAVNERRRVVRDVADQLADWRERATGRPLELPREEYFHHQVLAYVLDPGSPEYRRSVAGSAREVKVLARGFMRARRGTPLAHNSSFIASELAWMVPALRDIQLYQTIAYVRERFDVTAELKRIANAENLDRLLAHYEARFQKNPLLWRNSDPETMMRSELNTGLAMAFEYFSYLADEGRLPMPPDGRFDALVEELKDLHAANALAVAEALENDLPIENARLDEEYGGLLFAYAQWILAESQKAGEGLPGSGAAARLFQAATARQRRIREILGRNHVTPEDVLATDPRYKGKYGGWQPDKGRNVFQAVTLADRLAEQVYQGLAEQVNVTVEDLGLIWAMGGPKLTLALPLPLIQTLENLDEYGPKHAFDRLVVQGTQVIKTLQVFNPVHALEFAVRKTVTDFHAMALGDVHALAEWPGALVEVAAVMLGQRPGKHQEIVPWMQRGGLQLNVMLGEELLNKNAVDFLSGLGTGGRLVQSLKKPATYRKLITLFGPEVVQLIDASARYATYRAYLKILKANAGAPKNYAYSLEEEVLSLWGNGRTLDEQMASLYRDRAWKLSNDLMVAYDEVPPALKLLADRSLGVANLYFRWEQGNGRRWARRLTEPAWRESAGMQLFEALAKEAVREREAIIAGGGGSGPPIPPKPGGGEPGTPPEPPARGPLPRVPLSQSPRVLRNLAVVGAAAYASVALQRALGELRQGGELWRDLPPEERGKAPLLLGVDPFTGKTMVYPRLNSFQETLKPLGLDNVWEWRGHLTPLQQVELHGRDLVQWLWNLHGPTVNMVEAILGKSGFPSVFNPRDVKDRRRYVMSALGLAASWKYFEDLATRAPGRERFRIVGVREYDRLESNYYEIRDKVHQNSWLGGARQSAKSAALYQAHQAAREGDLAGAAQFLILYHQAGGDERGQRESLRNLDPLAGLNDAQAATFARGLDQSDQARLKGALLYWKSFVDPLDRRSRPVGPALLALPIERFVRRVRGDVLIQIKLMTPLADAARRSPENRAAVRQADRALAAKKRGETPVGAE